MFEISVESTFSSAHRLRGYKGKCEDLHGHNWKIRVMAFKESLDKLGLGLDFHILKDSLEKVIKNLDHKYLNQVSFFKKNNPTSENVARFIHNELKKDKKLKAVDAIKVLVWESEKNYAAYYE